MNLVRALALFGVGKKKSIRTIFSCFLKLRRSLRMASGCEKVQRVAGEGHQRVRNDHEQFLEAYESEFKMARVRAGLLVEL